MYRGKPAMFRRHPGARAIDASTRRRAGASLHRSPKAPRRRGTSRRRTALGPGGRPLDALPPRRLDDDPAAAASQQVAAARDRQSAILDQRPQSVDDRRRVPVFLPVDRSLRRQPRGERALADLVPHRLAQRSQLAQLALRQAAFVDRSQ